MLGLLLIGPIAMAIRRRRRESEADWSFALIGFAYVGIGCFFWALLQWGTPGESSAIIHAGTTAIPLVAIAACVAAMASVSTRLAIADRRGQRAVRPRRLHAVADAAARAPRTRRSRRSSPRSACSATAWSPSAAACGPPLSLRGGGPLPGATER